MRHDLATCPWTLSENCLSLLILRHGCAIERQAIAAVQSYAAQRDQVFRETPTRDMGIDAQLEFVR
jgi:hypothetical protein